MNQSWSRRSVAKAVAVKEEQNGWIAIASSVWIAAAALVVAAGIGASAAFGDDATGAVKIELNKLEQTDKGCRFYWLVNNQSGLDLKDLDLSFYWFQRDGIIGGDLRFAFAPAGAKSLKVKKYMLADQTCSNFASLLLNEINQCASNDGPVPECAKHLKYASRTTVEFLK